MRPQGQKTENFVELQNCASYPWKACQSFQGAALEMWTAISAVQMGAQNCEPVVLCSLLSVSREIFHSLVLGCRLRPWRNYPQLACSSQWQCSSWFESSMCCCLMRYSWVRSLTLDVSEWQLAGRRISLWKRCLCVSPAPGSAGRSNSVCSTTGSRRFPCSTSHRQMGWRVHSPGSWPNGPQCEESWG